MCGLSVCLAYLRNYVAELHQFLCMFGPPLTALRCVTYFRFCGRRRIFAALLCRSFCFFEARRLATTTVYMPRDVLFGMIVSLTLLLFFSLFSCVAALLPFTVNKDEHNRKSQLASETQQSTCCSSDRTVRNRLRHLLRRRGSTHIRVLFSVLAYFSRI